MSPSRGPQAVEELAKCTTIKRNRDSHREELFKECLEVKEIAESFEVRWECARKRMVK